MDMGKCMKPYYSCVVGAWNATSLVELEPFATKPPSPVITVGNNGTFTSMAMHAPSSSSGRAWPIYGIKSFGHL